MEGKVTKKSFSSDHRRRLAKLVIYQCPEYLLHVSITWGILKILIVGPIFRNSDSFDFGWNPGT